MINFIKKPKVIILIIFFFALGISAYFYFGREKKPLSNITVVQRGDLKQEVNITGRIKPSQNIGLAFEKGGRVSQVFIDVGDEVAAGQILVALDSSEIAAQLTEARAGIESAEAQLKQYQAALETQRARMAELKRGAKPEEIQLQETKVANAKIKLEEAKKDLVNTEKKADAELDSVYTDALTSVQKSAIVCKAALLTLTDIQYAHFSASDSQGALLSDAKAIAVKALLGQDNAGRWSTDALSSLSGGAFGTVQNAVSNVTASNIDQALSETADALEKTKQALNLIPVSDVLTSTEKTTLTTQKTNIATEIINVSDKQQEIAVQKITNTNDIASAKEDITDAQNTLSVAQQELVLLRAGSTREEINQQEAQIKQAEAQAAVQEAQIKQAEAQEENIKAQIAKTILRSPISGTVGRQEAKKGEIVAANAPIVSIISSSEFEIESNVPEADIAKLELGDDAEATLDAYGRDVVFSLKVVAIDPVETIIDGVATYKATFQFSEKSELIKSGMTADIDILTDYRQNVIIIPQRALITKNGDKFVRLLQQGETKESRVKTGLVGSDGNIEITEGLKEGDQIIISFE